MTFLQFLQVATLHEQRLHVERDILGEMTQSEFQCLIIESFNIEFHWLVLRRLNSGGRYVLQIIIEFLLEFLHQLQYLNRAL